ncbi:MAG: hypothetical protein NZM38_08665 [Cytophagales bacterium]|nr:hypothetical protein [Cytophagales bacterium]MDW8384830.1 hypothetical protein [Flammeovirgaceae bacterium]
MILLFENALGKIYQDDNERAISIQTSCFSCKTCVTQFKLLCKQVSRANIVEMLLDVSQKSDYLIIACKGFNFKVPIAQIILLQELLSGAKYVLDLNEICYRSGIIFSEIEENVHKTKNETVL